MTFLVFEGIPTFAIKFAPLALTKKKFPERIIPRLGSNLMNYTNVELNDVNFSF